MSAAADGVGAPRMMPVGRRPLRVAVRAGTGIPLVLCNGIGTPLEALDPLVDHLGPHRTVIRFDVPGAGGSQLGMLPRTLPQIACLLGRLIDALGHDRVDVLGYSWGGGLAQQFALQNPRRCRRLVLAATGTGALMIPARPSVLTRMTSRRRFTDPDHLTEIGPGLYGGTVAGDNADLTGLLARHPLGGSTRGYLYQLAAGALWTSLFVLPAIRQPTLVIAGTDDPLVPIANARILHRLLPHATLDLHDGGHLDLLTRSELFGATIEGFLSAP
ncbi:alpha/beta fold hydrolase [Rhodococcus sp. NPDC003348]